MSEQQTSQNYRGDLNRDELMSALFANLVLQQANMALMFLGKVPHPQTGKEVVDLEAAQVFIDNLEMLELKTKGNLTQAEEGMLKQSLMSARMTFVETADKAPAKPSETKDSATPSPQPGPASASTSPAKPAGEAPADNSAANSEAEARKKYVKKY